MNLAFACFARSRAKRPQTLNTLRGRAQEACRLLVLSALALLTPLATQALPHETFVEDLKSFDATFEQNVFDENGNLVETSTGTVALSEPNLFRWSYEEPFEQLIVADGVKVWSYDIDLEQVSVKDQNDVEAQSPLTMLTSPDELNARYALSEGKAVEGVEFVRLIPKTGEGELEFIDLGFDDEAMLAALVIKDGFGQRTEISFTEQCRNRELSEVLFQFAPPAGIDVIGEQESTQAFSIPDDAPDER